MVPGGCHSQGCHGYPALDSLCFAPYPFRHHSLSFCIVDEFNTCLNWNDRCFQLNFIAVIVFKLFISMYTFLSTFQYIHCILLCNIQSLLYWYRGMNLSGWQQLLDLYKDYSRFWCFIGSTQYHGMTQMANHWWTCCYHRNSTTHLKKPLKVSLRSLLTHNEFGDPIFSSSNFN